MPLTMTLGATTSTSQVLNFAGYLGTDTIRIQYSTNPNFANALAPSYEIAPAASHTMQKLNQASRYYVRARLVHQDGSADSWVGPLTLYTPLGNARDLSVSAVLIEPARIVVPEKMTGISGQDEVAGFPAANVAHDGPTAWRSSGATSHKLLFALGQVPIDTIAMLNTNLPEDATITIAASDTLADIPDVPSADFSAAFTFRASANVPGRPGYHGIFDLGAPRSYRYWNIFISATCPGGVAEIQHVVAGINRATKNHSVDKNEQPIDFAEFDRTRDGQPVRTDGMRGRRVDFDISMLTQAQYEDIYSDLWYRVGTTEPLLVVPNGKEGAFLHDRILYGVLRTYRASNPASPVYSLALSIESII